MVTKVAAILAAICLLVSVFPEATGDLGQPAAKKPASEAPSARVARLHATGQAGPEPQTMIAIRTG